MPSSTELNRCQMRPTCRGEEVQGGKGLGARQSNQAMCRTAAGTVHRSRTSPSHCPSRPPSYLQRRGQALWCHQRQHVTRGGVLQQPAALQLVEVKLLLGTKALHRHLQGRAGEREGREVQQVGEAEQAAPVHLSAVGGQSGHYGSQLTIPRPLASQGTRLRLLDHTPLQALGIAAAARVSHCVQQPGLSLCQVWLGATGAAATGSRIPCCWCGDGLPEAAATAANSSRPGSGEGGRVAPGAAAGGGRCMQADRPLLSHRECLQALHRCARRWPQRDVTEDQWMAACRPGIVSWGCADNVDRAASCPTCRAEPVVLRALGRWTRLAQALGR